MTMDRYVELKALDLKLLIDKRDYLVSHDYPKKEIDKIENRIQMLAIRLKRLIAVNKAAVRYH